MCRSVAANISIMPHCIMPTCCATPNVVLCRLYLSSNMLRQLPLGLYHCRRLATLCLDDNKLTTAAFPEEFSALTRLKGIERNSARSSCYPI